MRYPENLEKHGTIGFVAPSFGCNIEPYRSAFENALRVLQGMGFELDLGPNCYAGEGVGISNTPEKCGEELNEYFTSGKNDVLFSCGGGELMCEVLDYVDFDRLKKAPAKWFMGYSDNTNLTFLLTTLCDTASIYGPCAPAFGMEPWHPAIKDALDLVMGNKKVMTGYDLWEKAGDDVKSEENPLAPYHVTQKRLIRRFPDRDTVFGGRLLGGCMDCLVNLTGTRYDKVGEFIKRYEKDGVVWFLEACDLNVYGIRRAIWQMEHAGWFENAKGFLIGRPYCFGQEMIGLDQYRAVWEPLSRHQVPVLMDVDLGHLPPAMPLVCGSMASVEASGDKIGVKMEYI